jgi:UDPglucose 6-dehydrogenase
VGFESTLLAAVEQRNGLQKQKLFDNISEYFSGNVAGKRFGIWGLAFKPGTDDMREAPSIVLIKALVEAGAEVLAFDPVAKQTARQEFPVEWLEDGRLQLLDYQYDVLKQADAMVLVTEWKRFRQPDFEEIKELMNEALIFDGRNQYDPQYLADSGFKYIGIGRRNI